MIETKDFAPPRRTGFYAGAFERSQQTGEPLYAVAFRRSETSIVEIFKLDKPEEANGVLAMLIGEGVASKDMWPIVIAVGEIELIAVTAKIPATPRTCP